MMTNKRLSVAAGTLIAAFATVSSAYATSANGTWLRDNGAHAADRDRVDEPRLEQRPRLHLVVEDLEGTELLALAPKAAKQRRIRG